MRAVLSRTVYTFPNDPLTPRPAERRLIRCRRPGVIAAAVASAAIAVPAVALGAPAALPPIGPAQMIATPSGMRPVVRDVLVRFGAGTAARSRAGTRTAVLDAAGAQPQEARRVEGLPGAWRVPVDDGASPSAVARRLDVRTDVTWAVPDVPATTQMMPDDPLFPNLWGLRNTGQQVQAPTPFTGIAGMDLGTMGAWATTRGSADVSVAVVDTGTVLDHPDLVANLRTANDHNFVPDATGDLEPTAVDDLNHHGTHVAGTIGAVGNNGIGVTGVNWTVGMTTVRACDFAGSCTALLEGMAYAGPRARVVNISIAGGGDLQPSTDVIKANPNTLFVVAAGNDSSDNDAVPVDPCNVSLPNVLCVAAIDANGALAPFSNYGATSVDVAAPGVDIQSSVPNFGTAFAPPVNSDGQTPPRPAGWTQTPAAAAGPPPTGWKWFTASDGTPYMGLAATPGAAPGLDQWTIKAPGTFTATGRACRMNAYVVTDLVAGDNQSIALAYRTAGSPAWTYVGSGATSGDTGGYFTPWHVDLSAIDGQSGVELMFVVQSTRGAGPLIAGVLDPVVTCIVPQAAGGNYGFLSGTSMATPQVAGAAALLLAKNPDLTAAQLKHALMSTTVPLPALAGKVVTGGRIDVNAALASVPAPKPAAPSTPVTPAPMPRALTLRLGRTLAARAGRTRVSVPVTCEVPDSALCVVTVALRTRVAARGTSRARWIALGTRGATLPAGWKGLVSVPLTRQARALLGRHARVRTTVIVTSAKGSPARAPVRQELTLVCPS